MYPGNITLKCDGFLLVPGDLTGSTLGGQQHRLSQVTKWSIGNSPTLENDFLFGKQLRLKLAL